MYDPWIVQNCPIRTICDKIQSFQATTISLASLMRKHGHKQRVVVAPKLTTHPKNVAYLSLIGFCSTGTPNKQDFELDIADTMTM